MSGVVAAEISAAHVLIACAQAGLSLGLQSASLLDCHVARPWRGVPKGVDALVAASRSGCWRSMAIRRIRPSLLVDWARPPLAAGSARTLADRMPWARTK
eukprot:7232566-Pyramimonas_sp.AAC.1